MYNHLLEAQDFWHEFRDSRLEYMKQVCICHDLISNHRHEKNSEYLDLLQQEMPKTDLDGQQIFISKAMKAEVSNEADIVVIAGFRNQFKMSFFLYKRKKARWLTL